MHTHAHTHTRTHTTFPPLPRTHTLSTPAFSWYLPATHLKQAPVEFEKLPAGHWLSTQAEPRPANEYLPAPQAVQVEAPTAAENLPASHLKQALGELEKLPAGHWLSTQAEPRPANENLPAVQLVQVVDPALAAYFPAPQERQV